MSNILIIKHGSLGDLIQANGAITDIKNFYKNRKMLMHQIVIRTHELILCRLRAMLQVYFFMQPACLQKPSKTHSKPIVIELENLFYVI